MTDLKKLTIEPHGDGHAVYSGRTSLTVNADGSLTFGTHGNRLFNVTDATKAGLQVAHEMVAAVNAVPELLALRDENERLKELLAGEHRAKMDAYNAVHDMDALREEVVRLKQMLADAHAELCAGQRLATELSDWHIDAERCMERARAALNQEPGQ